jgi:NADPH:quinone reductase-like Zn-dependent oxidoreductase
MVDIAGSRSFLACRRALTPNARFVVVGGTMSYRGLGPLPHIAGTMLKSRLRSQTTTFFVAKVTTEHLALVGDLIESGKVRPVVERVYPLSEAHEALAHLGEGHARGKLVISV